MLRTKHRLESEHNAAITSGRLSGFDTSRPWDSVWKAVLTDTDFWDAEYKVSALLIASQTSKPAFALGGDAEVASGPSSSNQTRQPGPPTRPTKPTKPIKQDPIQQGGLTMKTETKDNPPQQICRAFNAGNCKSPSNRCMHGDRVHVCHFCLGTNHAGVNCNSVKGKKAGQPKKRGGGKNKKGKGQF